MGLDFSTGCDILAFVVEKKAGSFGREPQQVPKEVDKTIKILTGKDNGKLDRVISAVHIASELLMAKIEEKKDRNQAAI